MKLIWSVVTSTVLLFGSWATFAGEETSLKPHERRVIRDLLEDRSEDLSGSERRLLMELRRQDTVAEDDRRDFERIKRRELGVEEGERD